MAVAGSHEAPARPAGTRRAELVALASRLFRERGYHGVGMRAIADAADMQAASLYHHFRNKEELLLEGIFVVDRDLIVDQLLPILDSPGSHRERLRRLVRAHVLHIGANRDAWWVAARELRALSPEKFEAVQVYRRHYQNRIAQHLADGVRAGEFDCDDPRLTTLALLDMINGLNEWFDPRGRLSIEQIAERYAELSVRQLTP